MHTGGGQEVHAAKISTKFANWDPCMQTGGERVYMWRKLVWNSQMGIPICVMKLCADRLLMHHKLIPVLIRGLLVCVLGGRSEISHMGSPRLHNKIVRILGATYISWEISTMLAKVIVVGVHCIVAQGAQDVTNYSILKVKLRNK